jgi:hypothetical protein
VFCLTSSTFSGTIDVFAVLPQHCDDYRCVLTYCRNILTYCRCVLTYCRKIVTYYRCVLTYCRNILTYYRCVLTYCRNILTYYRGVLTYCRNILTYTGDIWTYCRSVCRGGLRETTETSELPVFEQMFAPRTPPAPFQMIKKDTH